MDSDVETDNMKIEANNAVDFIPEMERDWIQFEKSNRLNEPSAEMLKKRWYRQKFRVFINKWLTDRWVLPPKPLGNEDYVFAIYPDTKKEWMKKLSYLETVEPSDAALFQSWKRCRKIHFQNRWLRANTCAMKDQIKDDQKVEKEIASFCHLRKNFKYWLFYLNNVAVIEFLTFICGLLFYKYHT